MPPAPLSSRPSPRTALVTGSSSGIGAAFARRLAADGYRLVLVARDAERLAELATELRDAGSPHVDMLAADLTRAAELDAVADRLRDDAAPVSLLVNNAGLGLGREFLDVSEAELRYQLELNVTAVLVLTRAVLPGMVARGHGAVINVASIAAFMPARGAGYAAGKAWVLSFTEGLAIALKGTGVRVQALCPGLVRTDFHRRAGLDMSRTPGFTYVDEVTLVDRSLADLARNRVVSVPTVLYRAISVISQIAPRRWVRAGSGALESRRRTLNR